MHIFISYAKVDSYDLARRIQGMLHTLEGVTAWMDDSLEAASSWAAQIQGEIDRCDYMVVLLSPDVNRPATDTQSRSFVLNEIDYAQQERKTIIPVLVQPARIPVQLAGIQYVDCTKNLDQGLQRLENLIRKRMGKPEIADSAAVQSSMTRIGRKGWFGLLAFVGLVVLALVIVLNLPTWTNPVRTATPTDFPEGTINAGLSSNNSTVAADLATALYISQLTATSTPTLDSTQDIATRVAWIIASETAKQPTPPPTSTATPTADLTLTSDNLNLLAAALATQLRSTQITQLTLSVPTQVGVPTASPTPQLTATSTLTMTPTALSVAELEGTSQAQNSALVEMAAATANAQLLEQERIQRAAFAITFAFEGSGYASYQTYDSGIISYGRYQFTLAGDSLLTVIERYLDRSDSAIAAELQSTYLSFLQSKDETLREDDRLKELLVNAAADPVMQAVQDELAVETLWNPVQELSIIPRGIHSALGQALIFDIAINHGRDNNFLATVENELGIPANAQLPWGDVTETLFITRLAEIRRDSLYRSADRLQLPGLKARGDFWVNLIALGDWQLQGDEAGNVDLKGRSIQVRNP